MAQSLRSGAWSGMAEHVQNRIIHLVMSLLTVAVTLGGVMAGYWSMQASNREFMADLKSTLTAHGTRITSLEDQKRALDTSLTADRLTVERRITSLETYYTQTLATLTEIKQDVTALRDGQARRPAP